LIGTRKEKGQNTGKGGAIGNGTTYMVLTGGRITAPDEPEAAARMGAK